MAGPMAASRRVATLQMMQQRGVGPTHRVLSRADLPAGADRPPGAAPVFLVYPVEHGAPVPPKPEEHGANAIKLDDLMLADDGGPARGDDPVLKPARQPSKAQFPYAIEQPGDLSESVRPPHVADKRRDDLYDKLDDSEVNVIPYLQDYLPFATKRPPIGPPPTATAAAAPVKAVAVGPGPTLPPRVVLGTGTSAPPVALQQPQPISATLKTVVTPSPVGPPSRHETVIGGASGGSEFTVGAVMHTLSNHRHSEDAPAPPLSGPPAVELDDHGFQAPFQASVSVESAGGAAGGAGGVAGAPAGPVEGWSVLSGGMRPGTVDKADIRDIIKESSTTEGAFDFENFKPQLFGGFKPILHSADEAAPSAAPAAPAATVASTMAVSGEREER